MKKFTFILTVFISITIFANAQWIQANGTAGKKVTSFTTSGTKIFAGTYDGVLSSDNYGSDWSVTGMTSDVYALTVHGSYVYAANESVGLSSSSNNGTSWTPANNGISTGTQIAALTTSYASVFAGGNNGFYKSSDEGSNWTLLNNGLTNTNVTSIIANSPYLKIGTNGGGVFVSSDNGSSWTTSNSELTNLNVNALVFVTGTESVLYAGTSGGVFMYIYSGRGNWSAINNGLTNLEVNALVANGTDIYAGTQGGGLFKTIDNGANWISVNSGLPSNDILSLAIVGDYLLVGTSSEGIWKRSLSEITEIDELNKSIGLTMFPNPASDFVTLNLDNCSNSNLPLKIYNVVGTLVKSEILEQNNSQINIGDLSNGVYMVEIKSKDCIVKQKLIIQR